MIKNINDETIFEYNENQIVLCLTYNGIYGINNINSIMQEKNTSKSIRIGSYVYKENDPIIFTDNNTFNTVLYNNLKGKILSFSEETEKVVFTLSVDTAINAFDLDEFEELSLIDIKENKSIISLSIDKNFDSDKDEIKSKLVPFQIAYAVSIHKAQGLEYESVKIVITDDVDDEITHSIFYTAITRATRHLTIYWSNNTERTILSKINEKNEMKDIGIISSRFKYKIRDGNI